MLKNPQSAQITLERSVPKSHQQHHNHLGHWFKKKFLGLHLRSTQPESPGIKTGPTYYYKSTSLKGNLFRIKCTCSRYTDDETNKCVHDNQHIQYFITPKKFPHVHMDFCWDFPFLSLVSKIIPIIACWSLFMAAALKFLSELQHPIDSSQCWCHWLYSLLLCFSWFLRFFYCILDIFI